MVRIYLHSSFQSYGHACLKLLITSQMSVLNYHAKMVDIPIRTIATCVNVHQDWLEERVRSYRKVSVILGCGKLSLVIIHDFSWLRWRISGYANVARTWSSWKKEMFLENSGK